MAYRRPIRRILITNPSSDKCITKEGRVIMALNLSFEAPRMPLSMAIMAGGLESLAEVRIIDASNEKMPRAELRERMADFGPDLVIINCSTPTIYHDAAVARDARDLGAMTAMFGQHADAIPAEVMRDHPEVDLCFLHEPELVASDFVKAFHSGAPLSDLKGLAFRADDGAAVVTERHPYTPVDLFPKPARHLLDNDLYRLPDGERYSVILASRGCHYDCGFCIAPPFHGLDVRRRSPEALVAEATDVYRAYGIRSFLFQSDLFTSKKEWVLEVCRRIRDAGVKIRWICNSRVDTVDEETLREMKRAGCFLIGIGIESGSPKMLPILGKKHADPERIKWMVNTCRELGIRTNGSFVIGYPGETLETLRETEELVMQLPLDFAVFLTATAFPGTGLYQYLEGPGHGYRLRKEWDKFFYLEYVIEGGLSPEVVKGFVERMFKRYFFSLHYLRLRLRDVRHPVQLGRTLWYAGRRLPVMVRGFRGRATGIAPPPEELPARVEQVA